MKKRNSLFFMGLGCMALAFGAASVVNAGAVSAAESAASARIEYGNNDEKKSTSEYFKVVASAGAVLTYQEGKNDVSAEPDDSKGNTDIYYFKVPKKELNITVGATGAAVETKLSVTVTKAKGDSNKLMCKKATYDTQATGGYDYGNITAETDGVTAGAFTAFVPDTNGTHSDSMMLSCSSITYDPETMGADKSGNTAYVQKMNDFIGALLKDGATVTVVPGVNGEYYQTPKKYVYYEFTNDGTKLALTKKTDTCKLKAAKVKIAKLKNAPKVKIDAVKGTVNLSAKLEYRFVPDGKTVAEVWTAGTGKMSINAVSTSSITGGGILYVRTAATSKTLYSKTTSVNIPSQQAIKVSDITTDGVTTGGTIKAGSGSDYEYTTDNPADGGKTWKPIKAAGIKFTANKKAAGSYYIRKKGVNAKGETKLAMPSEIAVVTVSGDSLKITTDGTGTYVTTMSALY